MVLLPCVVRKSLPSGWPFSHAHSGARSLAWYYEVGWQGSGDEESGFCAQVMTCPASYQAATEAGHRLSFCPSSRNPCVFPLVQSALKDKNSVKQGSLKCGVNLLCKSEEGARISTEPGNLDTSNMFLGMAQQS